MLTLKLKEILYWYDQEQIVLAEDIRDFNYIGLLVSTDPLLWFWSFAMIDKIEKFKNGNIPMEKIFSSDTLSDYYYSTTRPRYDKEIRVKHIYKWHQFKGMKWIPVGFILKENLSGFNKSIPSQRQS